MINDELCQAPRAKNRNRQRTIGLAVGMFLVVSGLMAFSFAQESAPATPPSGFTDLMDNRQLTFLRVPGRGQDYELGTGDLIEVKIVGIDALDQTERISNGGQISLPMVGQIEAAGMTAEALENDISRRLAQNDYIKDPEVLVYVMEYRAKPIYVLGQVDRPGQYIMTQQLYLMDAILIAGGLDFPAARYGYLHRRVGLSSDDQPIKLSADGSKSLSGTTRVTRVDLLPMKQGGVLKVNPPLRKGDIFFVPKRKVDFFYIIGDVERTGAFEMPPNQDLLVSRALSWSGGPRKTAKMSEGILVRYKEDGTRQERAVDFAAILKGKEADFKVHPNDVIFVPGSNAKTLGYGMLAAIPRLAQSALIYGLIF